MRGFVDQSARLAAEVLAQGTEIAHPFSLCTALTWGGCLISLLRGDLETAVQSVGRLKQHSERYGLYAFYACAEGFEGQVFAARGDFARAEHLLRCCLDSLRRIKNDNFPAFKSTLGEVLAKVGNTAEAMAAVEELVERIERTRQLWWLPEALRIKGEILLLLHQADAAEDLFRQALPLGAPAGSSVLGTACRYESGAPAAGPGASGGGGSVREARVSIIHGRLRHGRSPGRQGCSHNPRIAFAFAKKRQPSLVRVLSDSVTQGLVGQANSGTYLYG
jgi:tetratricopeptide (TPR) repeat protein